MLKQKLCYQQYVFLRRPAAFVLVLFLYFLGTFDPVLPSKLTGRWLIAAVLCGLGLYSLKGILSGVSNIMASRNEIRVPFSVLTTDTPQLPIRTADEHCAILATGLYESSKIVVTNEQILQIMRQNRDYVPVEFLIKKNYFYMNALEYAGDAHEDNGMAESFVLSWNLTDADSAKKILSQLWESAGLGAHRPITRAGNERACCKLIQELGGQFADNVRETNISGFDIVRFAYLARVSHACGYISECDLRGYLAQAGSFIRQHYKSWEELAYSYLVMFIQWAVNAYPDYAFVRERVLSVRQYLSSEQSPLYCHSLDSFR